MLFIGFFCHVTRERAEYFHAVPLVSWSAGLLTICTNHADEKLEHKHKITIFDVVGESLHHHK